MSCTRTRSSRARFTTTPACVYRRSRCRMVPGSRLTATASTLGGKVIVISGDTRFSESLIAAAKGCDILVHEFYSQKGWEARTPEWQRYHAAFHISAPDLGRLAARVMPKKLVLYHELPMGPTRPDGVLGEIRQYFNGEVRIYVQAIWT